jgi:hypothetical protein
VVIGEPQKVGLGLYVGGNSIKLTAAQAATAQKYGLNQDMLLKLLDLFGPVIVKLLVNLLEKKDQQKGGLLDVVGVSYVRHIAAEVIREYKAEAGAVVEDWVEKALEVLAGSIDSK